MYDYLTEVALKQVWCAPEQDYQAILKPKRISPTYGVRHSIKQIWNTVLLPTSNEVYHVFHVGQLNPQLLGLFPVRQQWRAMSLNMAAMNMVVNLYNEKGVQLLRSLSYYQVTEDNNLLIAVREHHRTPVALGRETLYLRVYSNAYFNSIRHTQTEAIETQSVVVRTNQEILDIQKRLEYLEQLPSGAAQCYINGQLVRTINLLTAKVGDEIEYVFDHSIVRVVDFNVGTLRRFDSTLDGIGKYLLSYPADRAIEQYIEYHDDLDLYLYQPTGPKELTGTYIHRNDARTLRMVTHRDYGLAINTVSAIALNNQWHNNETLFVRLYVRRAGLERPLLFEHHRIQELYKLPYATRVEAMTGIRAHVPSWQAANLEASAYTRLMANKSMYFEKALVDEAFGYYGSVYQTSLTPAYTRSINGANGTVMPYNLITNSTVYEYDKDGALLNFRPHLHGKHYLAQDHATTLVEVLKGIGSETLSDIYNEPVSDYDPRYDHRFYVSDVRDGQVLNNWVDVTGTGAYAISGGKIRWIHDPMKYTMVRRNDTHLAYSQQITPLAGVLRFTLRHRVYRDQMIVTQTMRVPMGELDIYLNGKSLIEGIDYIVRFPEVIIISKAHLKDPVTGAQHITVRYTGFCDTDLQHRARMDAGFIDHGLASHNRYFNLRDDRVVRAVVGGATKHREEIRFAESHALKTTPQALNGQPYMLRDLIVPIKEVSSKDTYAFLAEAQAVDKAIEAYLGLYYPDTPTDTPNAIAQRYALYSPFLSAILYDIRQGFFEGLDIYGQHSDDAVRAFLTPYEQYLDYDPTQTQHQIDARYVEIHPHPEPNVVVLPVHYYRLMQRAVDLYCPGKVNLSHFLAIEQF